MTLRDRMNVAMGAARSKARAMGINPEEMSADDALAILDDIHRADITLVAGKWYCAATPAHIRSFKKAWKAWLKERQ